MAKKYRYVYVAYTDNLGYGKIKIAEDAVRYRCEVQAMRANKGCYNVVRERRPIEQQ